MTLSFTPDESEGLFYEALCNAFGTSWMAGYGLELTTSDEDYRRAKEHVKANTFGTDYCLEDIYMQVLHQGGSLTFIDHESEGEYTRSITLTDVHTRINACVAGGSLEPEVAWRCFWEEGDAADADHLLQAVFYEEIIFG